MTEQPPTPPLQSLVEDWLKAYPNMIVGPDAMTNLVERLLAREDNIADILRLAGVQFGLFSEIVAEVLAEVGIGSPIPDDQREFIRAQFVALMQRLQEEHGNQG